MHAFDHCRDDLSDIDFLAGGNNVTLPVFAGIFGTMAFLSLRLWIRRRIAGRSNSFGVVIFFLLLLGAIYMLVLWLKQRSGGKIRVTGKALSCRGNFYSADEISLVKCNWLGNVCVYVGGKKIASVSWDEENAELIIAWSRKCGISTDCDHTAFMNRLSKM